MEKLFACIESKKEEYLDFVYNVIKVNDIQFSIDRTQRCVYTEPDANGIITTKVYATIDEADGRTFFHEIGHAASLCKCFDNSEGCYELLRTATIYDRTLSEILEQELSKRKVKIKQDVLTAHRQCVEPVFGRDKYQSIADNADFLKEFNRLSRSIGACCGVVIPSSKNSRQDTRKFRA